MGERWNLYNFCGAANLGRRRLLAGAEHNNV